MKITIVAGARPNFMKIAPVVHAMQNVKRKDKRLRYRIVHTGQHFDNNMRDNFFKELNIPEPDINLNCGSGSQAEQTGAIMVSFEKELIANPADLVIVVGDVNSTMACSIVAKKLNTKVAHIEAGIRSYDLSMPEEINRIVTDCLADFFFTTTEMANQNLHKIGIPEKRIFFVGNVMIDTLLAYRHRFIKPQIWDKLKLTKRKYLVMTLHRPGNVDEEKKLKNLLCAIINGSRGIPIIFPVHPRTAKIIASLDFNNISKSHSFALSPSRHQCIKNLYFTEPLGYLEFIIWLKMLKQ
jgi:UDP-N-acetylglucosamine 2-epimerase (non-hydrolysing)